jgi:hypothetical protein
MPPSSDDLSKYVVKTDVTGDKLQNLASALASGEGGGDGAVFAPMEAIAAGLRAGNAFAQMFKIGALLFARGIIAPVELILRRKFGERYFNGLVVMSFLVCYLVSKFFLNIHWFYCNTILIVFVALLTYNQRLCYNRDRAGDYWHSYSEGDSKIRFEDWDEYWAKQNFTFDLSKLFIEPAIVLVVGLFCIALPKQQILIMPLLFNISPIAFYLVLAAVVMFLYQLYCYQYRRNLLLDEKDGDVIAEVRERLQSPAEKLGVCTHKGVSYVVLGGKK